MNGSIYRHNDNRYSLIVSVNGRQHWLAGEGSTDDDAEAFQTRVNAAILEGRYNRDDYRRRGPKMRSTDQAAATKPVRTVADAAIGWLNGVRSTVRPSTERRYQQIVDHICGAEIGQVDVGRCPVEAVERYREWGLTSGHRYGGGQSNKTVYEHLVVLRAIFTRAQRLGYVEVNPFLLLPRKRNKDALLPRRERHRFQVLSELEVADLIGTVTGSYLEAPVRIALDCGARLAEAVGMVWGDLDQRVPQITVRRQLVNREGDDDTKTSKTRSIPLTAANARALLTLFHAHTKRCAKREHLACLVFVGPPNGAEDQSRSTGINFARLARRLGLKRISFHSLRHTFATRQIMDGVNARTLSYWMGHSNPGFTLNFYTDWFEAAAGYEQAKTKRPLPAHLPQPLIPGGRQRRSEHDTDREG